MKLDEYDLKILQALQNDARLSLRDLAAIVHMSAPAISARIKALESAAIIRAYRVLIAPSHFGLNFEAIILISLFTNNDHNFIEFLRQNSNVISVDKITGAYSHMLKVAFKDVNDFNAFVDTLNTSFGRTQSSIVLKNEIPTRSPFVLVNEKN